MSNKLTYIIEAKDRFSGVFGKVKKFLTDPKAMMLAVGAAAVAAGAAVYGFAVTTANAYDATGKFAGRIGASTEALSRYHYAAEMSNVATSAMDTAWQRQTRRIAEAAQGTGEASAAIKELGLDARKLAQMAPEKQFEAIAGAMEKVPAQGDRVRLAMRLWDTEGVSMLQMLDGGTEGMKAMTAEADRLGLTISGKAAAQAAAFSDSMDRSKGAAMGLKNAIGEAMMPMLTGLSNRFSSFVMDNRGRIIEFGKAALQAIGGFVEKGAIGAGILVDSWRGLQMLWQSLKYGFAEFSIAVNQGLDFLAGKAVSFMESFNVGGVFDGAIVNARAFQGMATDGIAAMEAMSRTAMESLNQVVAQGSAREKVEGYVSTIKSAMSELQAEGEAAALAQGAGAGTAANVAATRQNIDALQAMHDELYLTEAERLDNWYMSEQAKYEGNLVARNLLDEIYLKKKNEVELKEQERQRNEQKKIDDKYAGFKNNIESNMSTVAQAMGKKTFAAYQKMMHGKAMVSALTGAVNAFSDYPYPASILMSAMALMSGLAAAAKVKDVSVAHGGMSYVPREQTYLLDEGERVLSPSQNRDFTTFIQGKNGGSPAGVVQYITNTFTVYARDPYDFLRQLAPIMKKAAQSDGVDFGFQVAGA